MSQNDIFCRYVTGINHIKFKTCPTHKDFTDQGIKQSVMSHLYNEKHVFSKAWRTKIDCKKFLDTMNKAPHILWTHLQVKV